MNVVRNVETDKKFVFFFIGSLSVVREREQVSERENESGSVSVGRENEWRRERESEGVSEKESEFRSVESLARDSRIKSIARADAQRSNKRTSKSKGERKVEWREEEGGEDREIKSRKEI